MSGTGDLREALMAETMDEVAALADAVHAIGPALEQAAQTGREAMTKTARDEAARLSVTLAREVADSVRLISEGSGQGMSRLRGSGRSGAGPERGSSSAIRRGLSRFRPCMTHAATRRYGSGACWGGSCAGSGVGVLVVGVGASRRSPGLLGSQGRV